MTKVTDIADTNVKEAGKIRSAWRRFFGVVAGPVLMVGGAVLGALALGAAVFGSTISFGTLPFVGLALTPLIAGVAGAVVTGIGALTTFGVNRANRKSAEKIAASSADLKKPYVKEKGEITIAPVKQAATTQTAIMEGGPAAAVSSSSAETVSDNSRNSPQR
jgi:hypothetical protein